MSVLKKELTRVKKQLKRANVRNESLRTQLEAAQNIESLRLKGLKVREMGKRSRDAIRWGVFAYGLYLAADVVKEIAGTTTIFSFLVDIPFVDIAIPAGAYISLTLTIILLNRARLGWRFEYEKLIAKYSPYQQADELEHDPKRTSSMLTQDGRTQPRDD